MIQRLGLISLAAAAVAAAGVIACGGETTTSGICSVDSDCQIGEICHPDAKVCVKTCSSGSDCTDEAKNCAPISATNSTKICQCVTDQLCQTGNLGTSAVCSPKFKVCCDSSNTTCVSGATTDGGTTPGNCSPACTGNQVCDPASNTCVAKCTFKTDCGAGKICNESSGLCEAAPSCNASVSQPDGCSYGQFCSGSSCAWVPAVDPATCVNFSGKPALNWSPSSSTGPVIFSVTKESQDTTFCSGSAPKNIRLRVKAYQKDGATWPMTLSGVQGFFYVKVDGMEIDATTLIRPQSGYIRSPDGKNADFLVNFCVPSTQDTLQVGLFFTNGNPFCGSFQQP